MTATITQKQRNQREREKARLRNAQRRRAGNVGYELPRWYGWPGYVVPSWQLRDYILANKHYWQAQYVPLQWTTDKVSYTNGNGYHDEEGWRTVLSQHAALILRKTPEAVVRRLYDYLEGRAKIAHAEFADAICLSLGHHIDNDAHLTILPGSLRPAEELITERATLKGVELTTPEVRRLAHRTVWLSAQIVKSRERHDRFVDKAPFGCLRKAS